LILLNEPLSYTFVSNTNKNYFMSQLSDAEETKKGQVEDKQERDEQREETNKTDPQLTELKGLVDPKEPLEEEGTLNPLTGDREKGE
jgi:hypothetical protein